jgi:polar amino acid transport system substrate-binding protein
VLLAICVITGISLSASLSLASSQLLLTTENYPPFNMKEEDTKKIIGISTDIVREVMIRAGISYSIKFLPWKRAYGMALRNPDTCVFSTTETAERKPKFKWVGPLVHNDWIFFGHLDSGIVITSIDDARKYVVGGYDGDAVAVYLAQQGFKLDLASHDRYNARKLAAGRFELWATGQHLGPYLANQAGVAIKPLFTFRETVMSLACNRSVDDKMIETFNAILADLRREGMVDQLVAKYY